MADALIETDELRTGCEHFFETARERYRIKLARESGAEWPWSEDPVFQTWRFCQVHREDDKTTTWFRDNVRSKVVGFDVVAATLIFRWFNRIETGEKIVDLLLEPARWNADEVRERLKDVHPVVTGAYIIKGADGMNKLDGILHVIDIALKRLETVPMPWDIYNTENADVSLRAAWEYLRKFYFLGDFTSYEAVSDLRWTHVLDKAPDIMTWANAGPGCTRGLGRVVNGSEVTFNRGSEADQNQMRQVMSLLLDMSQDERYWPSDWKQWEMREVEHWACEYDKYVRASLGDRMKRRFRQ